MHRDRFNLVIFCVMCVVLGALLFAFIMLCLRPAEVATEPTPETPIEQEEPSTYEWSEDDVQGDYSDLVAASYILLKANGITDISRDDLTEAYAPLVAYPSTTWSMDASEYLNRELPTDILAVPISGALVQFLPAPSIVWISMDGDTKPVLFTSANESSVSYIDPKTGPCVAAFTAFSQQYDDAFRQGIYIANRGYPVEE